MEGKIRELALLAILEYEAIPGLSGGKHLVRSMSVITASTPINETPDALQKLLTEFYSLLCIFGVDCQITSQVFKQVPFNLLY